MIGQITLVPIDVKMDVSVLEENSSFKMLGLTFSSKLDWGCYIISIAKNAFKKISAFIHSVKFLSPELALYLYKPTIQISMEYCCHVWAGAPSSYLELQDCWSFTCCFSSSEPAQLVPLPFSCGRSVHYSDRLHDFSVIILRY